MTSLNNQIESHSKHNDIYKLILLSVISYFLIYYIETNIAHTLGARSYGDYSFKLRILYMLSHILMLGQDGAMMVYLAKYTIDQNLQALAGFIHWLTKTILIRIVLILMISCVMIICSYYSSLGIYNWGQYLLFIPCIVLSAFLDRYFLYKKKYYIAYVPRNIIHPILFLGLIFLTQNMTTGLLIILYGCSLSIICVGLLSLYLYYTEPVGQAMPAYHKQWWLYAWHYGLSIIIVQTSRSANFFLLGLLAADQKEVGYYAAILKIVIALYIFTKPIDTYLKPWITSHHNNKKDFLEKLSYCNIIRWTEVIILWSIIVIFAEQILQYFGNDFVQYTAALRSLMTVYSIYTLGQSNIELLYFSDYANECSRIMVLKFILMIILSIILIPFIGLWGCLISDGCTSVLTVIIASMRCKHYFGFSGWYINFKRY